MERTSRFTAILRRWIVLFALVTLLIIVAGLAYYFYEQGQIRAEKYQELAAVAELKAGQILHWRQEQLADARRLASSPLLRRAVAAWLQDPKVLGLREDLEERFRLDQERGAYADVLLLDTEGRTLLSLLAEPAPLDPVARRALEEALASGKEVLSDFYRSPKGQVHLDAVAPILDSQGRPLAVVALRANAEDLLYPLIQSWPTPSRSAETLLVRVEGEEVLFLNDLRFQLGAALSLRQPLTRTDLPAVQAALGKQGIFEGRDYRGVKVLADLRPIPDSPWFMVAKVDEAEILAEARYRAGVTAFFVLLFILLAAVTTTAGYRQRQARLYRELYQAERAEREAQEEFRTTLYSIGDAVITTDTPSLVKQMNPEAERLTGWPEVEARGKPLDKVFHILNEESRAEVENPAQRVLREGIVVGLANHSLLVAKDGTERPIADSGAPIRDESGAIVGVVLVFRDQTEERIAQRALQESEDQYRTLVENADEAIFVLQEGRFEFCNLKTCKLTGYSREELFSLPSFAPLVHPDDRQMVVEHYQKRLQGEPFLERYDFRVLCKDGRVRWAELGATRVTWEGDLATLNFVSDVTERKQAEEALHALSARQEAILAAVPDIIIEVDANKVYTWANRAGYEFFGEDVLGKEAAYYFEGEQDTYGAVQPLFNGGGEVIYVESWQRRKDGQKRLLAWWCRVLKDERGNVTGALSTARDITEQRQAVEALRESSARLQAVFRAAPAGIGVVSWPPERRIQQVSEHFRQMLGRTSEELVGQNTRLLYPSDEDYDFVGRELYGQIEAHGVGVVETHWQRRDGSVFDVLLSSAPLDPADPSVGIAVAALDITERKRAEEERQKLEAQLHQAQKMEAVGRLAGGVAHDFNNMLGVILGYTEMVLRHLNPADPLYQDLQEIAGAARRSADLTRQLLAFSRRQTIAPKVLDLNAQLKGMERLLQRIIGEDIELEFELAPKLWPVRLDPSQIDQVVANLAVNSRDAMPDGGRLIVQTANMTFDKDYLKAHPWARPGDYVMLAVSDTGCGMSKEVLEHAFEPFFTTKEEGKGTGLGLATVYGIVKQNDGFIDLYSEPGQGTTVKLYFPRYVGEKEARPVEVQEAAPLGGRETILLVEDEASLRLLSRRILERLGYHVLEAASPEEAIALAEQHKGEIQLLLTDVVMPNMSGKELAERIKASTPGLKVLFMSGYTANAIAHRGVLEEGIHFLQKPFTPDDLGKKIREVLGS